MEDKLHSLRQQLEQTYSLEPKAQTSPLMSFWTRLQVAWRNSIAFTIAQPESQPHSPEAVLPSDYTRKIRLYPYLPAMEEQRDWLENTIENADSGRNFLPFL